MTERRILLFPEQFSQPFESGKAFLAPGGKNQMPYKHSFLKHPSPVEDRISHLPVHFRKSGFRHSFIVGRMGGILLPLRVSQT